MKSPRRSPTHPAHEALDPRTLGRPVHLLPRFVEALRGELTEVLRTDLNRRYQAGFAIDAMSIARLTASPQPGGPRPASPDSCRWLYAAGPCGLTGVALGRRLLLAILDYRYGQPASAHGADETLPRETATEERLATRLGTHLLRVLAERLPSADGEAGAAAELQAGPSPRAGSWAIEARISEAKLGELGSLWFSLDDSCLQAVLTSLAPHRERRRARTVPLATELRLKLTGRLVEREVTLGALMDLRVGALIPVSLGSADVLIDDSRLFSAQVAEHKGKLCLTAFEDQE